MANKFVKTNCKKVVAMILNSQTHNYNSFNSLYTKYSLTKQKWVPLSQREKQSDNKSTKQ